MGNEGSMEGGEGMGGLAEGIAADGRGGFAQIPAGMEAQWGQLSEEERKQIAAVMSRAQDLGKGSDTDLQPRNPNIDKNQSPRHPSKPPDPGPTGLTKSRTVDAFKTEVKAPGRSPSTISLKEPRSKPDIKEEQKSSMMSSFLTDSNPLNVVSSVVNKFSPFDSKSDPGANQEEISGKQKFEHEKTKDGKVNVIPSQQQQQSPKATQHKGQPMSTTVPSVTQQQQSSKPTQLQHETKPISSQQSPSRKTAQPSDATKPPTQSAISRTPLPHPSNPIKPAAIEQGHSTSLPQVPEAKTIQDRPAKQLSQPVINRQDRQHGQQLPPSKQPTYSQQGFNTSHQPSETDKKPVQESKKQPTPPQGNAKTNMEQAVKPPVTTKNPQQQSLPIKQPSDRPGPLKQQHPVMQPLKQHFQATPTTNAKQTEQKMERAKPIESKEPTQQHPHQLTNTNAESKKQNGAASNLPMPKTICPLCKSTELFLGTKENVNYNTCTQCQTTVCSLCGFNPNPHITEKKEWLCLNCQMQRALAMDATSNPPPPPTQQPLKQKPIPASPQKKSVSEPTALQKKEVVSVPNETVTQSTKKPPLITKQLSVTDSPTIPLKKPPDDPLKGKVISKTISDKTESSVSQKKQQVESVESNSGIKSFKDKSDSVLTKAPVHKDVDTKIDAKSKPVMDIHPTESKAKKTDNLPISHSVQEDKSRVVPFSESKQMQKSEAVKSQEAPKKSPAMVNPKLDGKQVQKEPVVEVSPKPSPTHKPVTPQTKTLPTTQPQKSQDQQRRFSLNLGSVTETPKPQPTTPQETVTGKLFGFGASIFSQASSFISTAAQPGTQPQPSQASASKPPPSQQAPDVHKVSKESVQVPQSPKSKTVTKETKPVSAEKPRESGTPLLPKEKEQKIIPEKQADTKILDVSTRKEFVPEKTEKISTSKQLCLICQTELNVGSKDPPNFNACTECKKTVCNLCGFNPTPHLTEVKEWLCLNCQTQRAMAGQLGDRNKIPPSLETPKSSPKHAVSAKPQAPKSATLPFTPVEKKDDQTMKKDVPKDADTKPDQPSTELNEQSKVTEDKLPVAKVPKPAAAAGLPTRESEPYDRDVTAVIPSKEMQQQSTASERKITQKADLMIDLSAKTVKENEESIYKEKKTDTSQVTDQDIGREKTEKEDDKSDISSSQQQKSPQGLSDTGYSSDGISSSLGEIPSLIPSDEKELPKEPLKKESLSHENSPSSPSDLAKLESTVLSILEAQTSVLTDENLRKNNDFYGIYPGQTQDRTKTKMLPITPESYSSEEEDLEDIQEAEDVEILEGKGGVSLRKSPKDSVITRRRHDSLDDSSESENSPVPQRKRRASNESSSSDEYKQEDSQGSGDDEDFIRKQIIEMSADEDASGSEDEEFIKTKLKEISINESQKKDVKAKPTNAKCKRLTKKSSISYDDDGIRRHSWHDDDEEDEDEETYDESPEPKHRETKSQESEELGVSGGGGLRRFKTIELNSTISNAYSAESNKLSSRLYYDDEPELEMESLTDSPEDRSREERSSSLHASSFTPGTSPTSVSSLDEDSDSSPSHKKMSGESKQQRKARHRSHGPVLPTIEDSSEEEELREEEELLKEQEKQRELEQQQRKGSSKKSKKDKDELRAQRRRERPKTPPSNLSPIEDASPTEELRQAAEMEELHRSSCSEYSPSIESEPEGFEISPEKIIEVQKVYKLPTSVSLFSPTDVATFDMPEDKNCHESLKNAEEAYEEIICKAKLYQNDNEKDDAFEKEPLYGGMLIEDYIYESLVEESYNENLDATAITAQENVFEHRLRELQSHSKEDIGIDAVPKITNLNNECFTAESFHSILPQEDIVSSSYIVPESHEIVNLDNAEERELQVDNSGIFEYINPQDMQLTPGSSPTQSKPEFVLKSGSVTRSIKDIGTREYISSTSSSELSSIQNNAISIPDVKITQHFTIEEIDDDFPPGIYEQKASEPHVSESTETFVKDKCDVNSDIAVEEITPFKNADQPSSSKQNSKQDIYPDSFSVDGMQRDILSSQNEPFSSVKSTIMHSNTSHIDSNSVIVPIERPCLVTKKAMDHVVISVPDSTPSTELDNVHSDLNQTGMFKSTEETTGFINSHANIKGTEFISSASPSYPLNNYGFIPSTEKPPVTTEQSVITSADIIISSPKVTSVISSIPAVTSKVKTFFKSTSMDSPAPLTKPAPPPPPPPPPLPRPTPPKPDIYLKKKAAPKAPSTTRTTDIRSSAEVLKHSSAPAIKPHAPPVPPKPSLIPSGLVFSHKPMDVSKTQIMTKTHVSDHPVNLQKSTEAQQKTKAQSISSRMTLNLTTSTEFRPQSPTSPLSPHSNKSSPRLTKPSQETYVVITLPSEPGTPTDSVTALTTTCWPLQSPQKENFPQTVDTVFTTTPLNVTEKEHKSCHTVSTLLTHLTGAEDTKAVFSIPKTTMSDFNSSNILSDFPKERSALNSIQIKETAKITEPINIVDLRTLSKIDYTSPELGTDICMDLSSSPVDVKRQSTCGISSRQISTIQPAIVNLSTASPIISSVSLVTESVTIVTCSTTVSYTTSLESLVDLGNSMKAPLKLTTSKEFEDGSFTFPTEEVPINLSLGTPAHPVTCATTKPISFSLGGITNGSNDISTSQESVDSGVVDLSTTKPHRTMVTMDEITSEIITEIVEDDKPVDLTAGRRAVCCDVVYRLPFGRSCISEQPSTCLPEDRFGYRDDHYQYDRSGHSSTRGGGGMKSSMSDTNLAEAGVFLYKSKNSFDYPTGLNEVAVDLTSGKITTGEALDYQTKTTGVYPETRQVISGIGISAPQYSQARMTNSIVTPFGMGSVLRSSNGVVYSSVATPIPSTFAITTQPGSIFSTTVRDLSSFITSDSVSSTTTLNQTQPLPRSYSMLATTASDVSDAMTIVESGLQIFPEDVAATTAADLVSILTTDSESFMERIEDDSAFIIPPENGNQLHLQRELLELEKLKQQRLAEELEWERQEIQRFREQETIMVQKKLEELQSMKQHLLFQQEEERQAQFMMRQETMAQQQLHLEQIQQLQHQLHQQLEEQKLRQMYQYNYDPTETVTPQTSSDQVILEAQYPTAEDGQFWTSEHSTATAVTGIEIPPSETWYAVQSDGITQYISKPSVLNSVSEMSLKDIAINEERQKKRNSVPRHCGMYEDIDVNGQEEPRSYKLIVDSGVQTDDEDAAEKEYTGRRRRSRKGVDTSVQTDDEDQEEWEITTRSRRRSRTGKYSEGNADVDKVRPFSKVSSIAVQTVAETSVQTEPLGTIRIPSARAKVDTKVEIIKHISAPEKNYKGESLGCQTETDSDIQNPQYPTDISHKDKRRPTPLEIGYSSHLRADSSLQVAPSPPKSPKVLYSPVSPVSPGKVLESAFIPYEKTLVDDNISQKQLIEVVQIPPPSPKSAKVMQRSMSDPKPLSPTAEDIARTQFQYTDGYMTKTIQSGTQKKVKRTLPNPPPEEANGIQSPYSTVGSVSRRRICRTTTMARAKILQDIDRELDLVERESSKLRKKQAELDEEEKEIDAKLRYLEMGINRRKEALLKEREKRERAYLQGVAEERDYMSDSEVSNTRPTRIETHIALERPQTAPQTEFSQYLPPQTQSETQFVPPTSPYTQFQYQTPSLLTQAPTQYTQQSLFQPPLFHQQPSTYQTQPTFQAVPTMSFTPQIQSTPSQQSSYQHPSQMLLIPQKTRQAALDLDSKITTHYDVIRNQPLIIAPVSSDGNYSVSHLGSKYSTLDLRLGLNEKGSMASSPMSSISSDSFYADLEHHASRNYVLIDDIGELTKGSGPLNSAFALHEKELSKTDRLLRTVDSRRTEVTDFLAPMSSSARLHSYGKTDEDSMEDPYELKLLKHQIKQEFRRGTESLDPLTSFAPYYHSDSLYRHFPKTEKYSISRLTLEKQAAKQLPPAILYQKQSKHKKALIDPKIAKFSPIQESRDLEPDYSTYLSSSTSSIPSLSSKVRMLQDDITYGLRKNITDQQKFLGPALAQNLGTTLSPNMRTPLQDEADKPYVSGSRSRPSSRPSSVYGLDLSIKRDLSSSSLRLKANETETLDGSFSHVAPSGRTKPSSLPISQSRGRIPIVAQNSEEESPLSPVGQPMGMARAAAGPLPPISADTRDQFGSSHSLPEVQQHMREESRTRGYDRDIAFIMDDFQHAMSDSEAYHLRREETDWFDKPRESRLENGHGIDRRLPDKLSHSRASHQQEHMNGKPIHYAFPHSRIKLQRDAKDHTVSGNGFGIRVVGGKEIPGNPGGTGAYIAKILPGGDAEHTGRLTEGMQVLEWNGFSLTGKTYEEVQSIISQSSGEAELCVRLDFNMLSNCETPQNLELHDTGKALEKTRSPGVDPKQLAAELQKVSQQQTPSFVSSAMEKGSYIHSGTTSAGSSAVPSPGQPGSPSVSKKRHSSKSTEAIKSHSHPITGELQLQVNYDKHLGNLIIHILQARNLAPRDNNGYSDPFVKVYLLPGRGQVMVVQNASAEYKRRTKYVQKSLNPEWNQTVIYKNISMEQLKKKTLEVTVWDYDRFSSNDFLGEVLIDLSNASNLDNIPRWYFLKEQSESIDHAKPHSGQSGQQAPKPSVIKSRSHGIFPDPSKDMQVPTIEKSHSSPGSSKSSSEGHLRSHGPSRSQSKTSVTQTHLEDAGAAIAAAEAAVQQLRLQPTNDNKDQSQHALKKVVSDGSVKPEAKSTSHRPSESVSTTSSVSSFGSGYGVESDGSSATGDSNLFPVPRIGKINQNGQDLVAQAAMGITDAEGTTQMMGEIKIALKKEMKTDGEQLIVEILQCRNITYKFKSPDHLPDLYVKLYVINIATQKRILKKKTRVCRHDREPSFNETFRFSMSPAGHSLQILLVSNGGKFMKKTLIGEAYIWLDKVDLRKRIVNWHKLLVSSAPAH
ncbi:protein piccolo isoform X2 [Xenopus tropicalis]|uniref:Protein piccolo n=1 Tax=Xenopus tropicalis TaxID=8364 RepID=A0A6I8S477_XENTR|nr:protein piccolo isoform X2 [Xenopus tropicalis]